LFHHHDESFGTRLRGIVTATEPGAAGHGQILVQVRVKLPDGRDAQFSQELANLYQPAPGSPAAQRLAEMREAQGIGHPTRIPKIQLPLRDGAKVPVRGNATGKKFVIDEPALQRKALDEYIERETTPRATKTTPLIGSGPPWKVSAECPRCGAPVDQALASKQADPMCAFCHEPIPVEPLSVSP